MLTRACVFSARDEPECGSDLSSGGSQRSVDQSAGSPAAGVTKETHGVKPVRNQHSSHDIRMKRVHTVTFVSVCVCVSESVPPKPSSTSRLLNGMENFHITGTTIQY